MRTARVDARRRCDDDDHGARAMMVPITALASIPRRDATTDARSTERVDAVSTVASVDVTRDVEGIFSRVVLFPREGPRVESALVDRIDAPTDDGTAARAGWSVHGAWPRSSVRVRSFARAIARAIPPRETRETPGRERMSNGTGCSNAPDASEERSTSGRSIVEPSMPTPKASLRDTFGSGLDRDDSANMSRIIGRHGSARGILSPSGSTLGRSCGRSPSEVERPMDGTYERTKSVTFEDDLPHGFPERKASFSRFHFEEEDALAPLSGFVAVVLSVVFVALSSRLITATFAALVKV